MLFLYLLAPNGKIPIWHMFGDPSITSLLVLQTIIFCKW